MQPEFESEFGRLTAIFPPATPDNTPRIQALKQELERRFSSRATARWRDIVTWVIDHHQTRAMPTVKEFSDAEDAVVARSGNGPHFICSRCSGERFVRCQVEREEDGYRIDAVSPCPDCNRQCDVHETPGYRRCAALPKDDSKDDNLSAASAFTPRAAAAALACHAVYCGPILADLKRLLEDIAKETPAQPSNTERDRSSKEW